MSTVILHLASDAELKHRPAPVPIPRLGLSAIAGRDRRGPEQIYEQARHDLWIE